MSAPRPVRVGAVILAAGEGRRMGRPKALLPLEGRTFVEVLIGRLGDAGAAPIVLVLGSAADEVRRAVSGSGARIVQNPDPARGQLSSIHCGLDALASDDLDGIFVAPVDTPRVRVETLRRMLGAFPGRPLVVPTFRGRRGHPALFASTLFPALRQAPPEIGARAVVRGEPGRLELELDDPAVLEDFDRPDDLDRA
jgi:CTP:molybdopterin cytidylyltransferase MocA